MSVLKYTLPIGILFVALLSCDKEEKIASPPEAKFVVSPEAGNTTTIFTFNTSASNNPGELDTMLFFRWDWDNDGEWDTHFSRSRNFENRFKAPGVYTVKMEASNQGGLRDTISTIIEVERGNSPPQPHLNVDPLLGHIRTVFTFDASGTIDDEDSLSTLVFRWDWEGDGMFDTPFSSETIITHVFPEPGYFRTFVEVKDPWGYRAKRNRAVQISLDNPLLVANFTWNPEDGTTSDILTFDASECYDPEDPSNTFTYRWDFNNDDFYDTDFLTSPIVEYQYQNEGEHEVKLEITDQYGLSKRVVQRIVVGHSNQPPAAIFKVGTKYGNLTTNFFFDANGVTDDEDWEYQLQVRWDFTNDGTWDTDFSVEKTAYHFFGVEGSYTIRMEVKDSGGLTSSATTDIEISNGTNETGLIIDQDNNLTYGSVKIGSQWWMSENLKSTASRSCFANSAQNCSIYGGLYSWNAMMGNTVGESKQGICPDGWHIPDVEEWDQLLDYMGRDVARKELEVGGSTDFRMLYAGQIDTNGNSTFLGIATNFWTSSDGAGSNAWSYSFQTGKDQIWKLILGRTYKNSVRCIKN